MMLILFILFLMIVALDILALKWGFDSRCKTTRLESKDAWVGSPRLAKLYRGYFWG